MLARIFKTQSNDPLSGKQTITSINRSPLFVIPPCMLVVAISYGLARYSFGLFLPTIRIDLDISVSLVSTIISASYIGYLISTIVASNLSGKVGPRVLVFTGGMLASIGMALIATTSSVWLMGFGVLIAGMSPGLVYPPLSDAITRLVTHNQRDWVYSVVNSGTSIGIMLCVPLALTFSQDWRLIYGSFAIFSAIITIWASLIVPTGAFIMNTQEKVVTVTIKWLFNQQSLPLFLSALIYGIASAVPWTFAPGLLQEIGQHSPSQVAVFWFVLGVGGLLGGAAAKFIGHAGLTITLYSGLMISLSSIAFLALWPDIPIIISFCATLFGASFILVTGLYGVWAMHVFSERPSAGFGLVFLIISLGQFVGTLAGGTLIDFQGYTVTFVAATAIGAFAFLLKPQNQLNEKTEPPENIAHISTT